MYYIEQWGYRMGNSIMEKGMAAGTQHIDGKHHTFQAGNMMVAESQAINHPAVRRTNPQLLPISSSLDQYFHH
jgi:hypothetical protein